MNYCEIGNETVLRFLHDELNLDERRAFLVHLKSCSLCRARLAEEESLSRRMRQSRPLYSAPDSLRLQISKLVDQHQARDRRGARFFRDLPVLLHVRVRAWSLAAIAIALVVSSLIFVPNIMQRARAASYVETAVAAHRNYVDGKYAPEIQSTSAQEISGWISGRVSFPFRLPVAEDTSTARYQIVGARLLHVKGSNAAMVMYENRTEPQERVSLLIAPENSALVAGSEEIPFGHLIFHVSNSGGFRVATWNAHSLSYALVSSISGTAQQSCLVCH